MSIVTETLDSSHPGVCGAVGCHEDLQFVARHADRGEVYVCREHARALEIVRRVEIEDTKRGDVDR